MSSQDELQRLRAILHAYDEWAAVVLAENERLRQQVNQIARERDQLYNTLCQFT